MDFYKESLERFTGWVQFGDAKAAAVLVLLGLGLADLLDHARRLVDAHKLESHWGDLATGCFWGATGVSAVVVGLIALALFPRVKAASSSLYFFGSVAQYKTSADYGTAVAATTPQQQEQQLAAQVWELARIADTKFRFTRRAFFGTLIVLVLWALGRLSLALATG